MRSRLHYAFTWDEEKAQSNERKHGVAFQAASTVFLDPLAAVFLDPDNDTGEERWVIVGLMEEQSLVVIAHTYGDGNGGVIVRIISARRATRNERRNYESEKYLIREPTVKRELKIEEDFEMRDEYDFSNAERGKFYLPNATYSFPIYLEWDVLKHFTAIARSRGVETRVLLNEILRRQMPAAPAADTAENR